MASRTVLATTAVLLLGGAATWYLLARSPTPAEEPAVPPAPTASAPTPVAPLPVPPMVVPPPVVPPPAVPPTVVGGLAPPPTPLTSVDSESGYVRLPDGSYVPNLNGVTGSARLKWGPRPFPGIKGRFRHTDGNEWYLLNDGHKRTTVWQEGTIRGVTERRALLITGSEKPALPGQAMPLGEGKAEPGR